MIDIETLGTDSDNGPKGLKVQDSLKQLILTAQMQKSVMMKN
jgi:hypothetical protein